MSIRMTKDLPTEAGRYFYCSNAQPLDAKIIDVELIKRGKPEYGLRPAGDGWVYGSDIESMRGYWAKVEKSQFEFEQ